MLQQDAIRPLPRCRYGVSVMRSGPVSLHARHTPKEMAFLFE